MAKIAIDIKGGEIKKVDKIYGIDLGTTNSLIAHCIDNVAHTVKLDGDGDYLVPSIVHFRENGEIVIGDDAKKLLLDHPERTIYSAKRLLGKSYQDLEQDSKTLAYEVLESGNEDELVKLLIDGKYYSPIQISAEILRHLKAQAEKLLGEDVNRVVITVPAYFNDSQRQATRDAGKLAGLDVVRIVNEPTAAALAYGLGQDAEDTGIIAVYDLGGGTFDITILELHQGIFEVLATNGDTHLGGDDFEQAIVDHWVSSLSLNDPHARGALRIFAERAKIALSSQDNWAEIWNEVELSLNRAELNSLLEPIITRTIKACEACLKDAELEKSQIDKILLVGGSTRVPLVRQMVQETFGRKPDTSLDPDRAVALGAAVQADILAGNNPKMLLLDVTPLSLGIETVGGLMDVIIARNTKIPYKARRQYTTSVDGQVNLNVSVYQGERDLVQDNRKLGEFVLRGIPPMAAGIPKIEITFALDADGILQVTAEETRSQTKQDVQIRPSYGISEEDMAKMLIESLQNAEDDMQARKLLEAKTELKLLIQSARKFVNQNQTHLTDQEKEILETKILELVKHESLGADQIQNAIKEFDQSTRAIAERIMDISIQDSLSGSKI